MPPPILGILLSISIITALSVAVYENPHIQAWLEEQRKNLVELLRSVGEQLDPNQRRMAEAFAYEGRTPANDPGLRRESRGSQEATAMATGRSMAGGSAMRRIPVKGPNDPDEAEERRRKGRDYLARRNQQMFEMQQRRKGKERVDDAETPMSPTSFDAMVDAEGKLRLPEQDVGESPDPPMSVPVLEDSPIEMKDTTQPEMTKREPMLAEESGPPAWWQVGSRVANPFDDENAMDLGRSETPKPPVPPKVALSDVEEPLGERIMPGSFTPRPINYMRRAQAEAESGRSDLSYEEQEQLAIALSLSDQTETQRRQSQTEEDYEDAELRAAIAASLRDQRPRAASPRPAPLIDITESAPTVPIHHPTPRGHWESLFDQEYSPAREPLSAAVSARSVEEDELYRVTPQLTRARLASLDALPPARSWIEREALEREALENETPEQARARGVCCTMKAIPGAAEHEDEDLYDSAPASPARSQTLERETQEQLVDTTIPPQQQQLQTPTTPQEAFESDSDASSDTFASLSAPPSRAQISAAPSTRHEDSDADVEVLDITNADDSDVDMLSEVEGDGIRTPDSWTEVGSRDGESESEWEGGGRTWAEV